jgi:hypothetical protein
MDDSMHRSGPRAVRSRRGCHPESYESTCEHRRARNYDSNRPKLHGPHLGFIEPSVLALREQL